MNDWERVQVSEQLGKPREILAGKFVPQRIGIEVPKRGSCCSEVGYFLGRCPAM